jgi:hypothetical protein
MSVDDRLREAFGATDHSWDEQAPSALLEVTRRHRRERLTRRTVVTVAAAAVTAAVMLVATNPGDRGEVPAPQPPTPTPTSEVGNPLDGLWVSEPITRADVRRVARLAGDTSDAATMLDELPAVPFRVTLNIDGDRNELIAHARVGDQESVIDQENVELDGDQVRLTAQFADGETVHGWSLTGSTLRFTFVSTTEAPSDGVPAEAWQRLLYDTAVFTAQQ